MVVISKIKEMSYLMISLFGGPSLVFILGTLSFLAALYLSALIRSFHEKRLCLSQSHMTYCNRRQLGSFPTKTIPLNPVLQIDDIIVLFPFFLNLGFYCI